LVEAYAWKREVRDTSWRGLRDLCHLLDLELALKRLPPDEHRAVLLHGLLGHTTRVAAMLLDVHRSLLIERYKDGLAHLTTSMNGG
jgi:DNA-directed RNA polymerase specialized sigma24 family protein